MPGIHVDMDELSTRPATVKEILHPLVVDPDGKKPPKFIQCERAPSLARRQHILAVHGGGHTDTNYQTWRFSTYRWDFWCKYYEIWVSVDERSFVYELNRAYFTLFQVFRRPPREENLLALHCDPIVEDADPHALYKQGPHLHMDFAEDPLPHAHIALNRSHLAEVLQSADSLSVAFAAAISMLKEQILELKWPAAA